MITRSARRECFRKSQGFFNMRASPDTPEDVVQFAGKRKKFVRISIEKQRWQPVSLDGAEKVRLSFQKHRLKSVLPLLDQRLATPRNRLQHKRAAAARHQGRKLRARRATI